jgi:hypothetical protein
VSRRRTGRPRGRPKKRNARRRETTRAGRRGNPYVDLGTPQLRFLKMRIAGVDNIDITDHVTVLFARRLIDEGELITLHLVRNLLDRVRQARGLKLDLSVNGLWAALTAGSRAGFWVIPTTAPDRRTAADVAWWRLAGLRNQFFAAGKLAELDLVMALIEGRSDLLPRIVKPHKTLEELRALAADIDWMRETVQAIGDVLRPTYRRAARRARG